MNPEVPSWRTSSYTGSETCVEVADSDPMNVMVRDTKMRNGGVIVVRHGAWAAFVASVNGEA
ncbi:DUF397 domain-containing protein [Streptomyces sp. NPDC051985]|uniref:DUF397 domain-containing protein n=1 Tax=Streptomyces sp. NPDC051985 TaxID=3155807 RepID=UPI0034136BA6